MQSVTTVADVNTAGRLARSRLAGVLAGVVSVSVVAGAIALFDNWVPVLSLGALFVFSVLPVAVFWGTPYAVLVAVASILTFKRRACPKRARLPLGPPPSPEPDTEREVSSAAQARRGQLLRYHDDLVSAAGRAKPLPEPSPLVRGTFDYQLKPAGARRLADGLRIVAARTSRAVR